MSRKSTPVAVQIPRWPATNAILNADGSGRLTIDGRGENLQAGDLATSRALVIRRVTETAKGLERAVRLTSVDPDGEWELAIYPDGTVRELAARPTADAAEPIVVEPVAPAPDDRTVERVTVPERVSTEPTVERVTVPRPEPVGETVERVTVPAPASSPRQRRAARAASAPRRRPLRRRPRPSTRLAVAAAFVLAVGVAVAIIVTNGPATVVSTQPTTPAPTLSASTAHPITDAAIAVAERKGRARAALASRRHAALLKRVAARTRREARQRAARRRTAAAARRRAARARQTASRPQRTRQTPPPAPIRPPAARKPPPPPPPPPPATACGDFDLC